MSKLIVAIFCTQAVLTQLVLSHCISAPPSCGWSPVGPPAPPCGYPPVGPPAYLPPPPPPPSCYGPPAPPAGPGYGGQGTGEFSAQGEVAISEGSTVISGSLPTTGVLQFNGNVPASGSVVIVGSTPPICGGPVHGHGHGHGPYPVPVPHHVPAPWVPAPPCGCV